MEGGGMKMNNVEHQISKLVEVLKEKRILTNEDIDRVFNEWLKLLIKD